MTGPRRPRAFDDLASVEVDAIELVRVRLPLRTELASAHGVERSREVVLVRALGADGVEGWGECSALESPTYTHEYTDGAWLTLRAHLVPAALAGRFDVVRGHPMAFTAVEVALTDLQLRREGRSLVEELGGAVVAARGLRWTAVVGVQESTDVLGARVDEVLARGAAAVKLKVHPGWGLAPVSFVRDRHPDLVLAVDANGSFDPVVRSGGFAAIGGLSDLAALLPPSSPADGRGSCADRPGTADGSYVEQPFGTESFAFHAALVERLAVVGSAAGVALDESITSESSVTLARSVGAATGVNIKPARLGGLARTQRIRDLLASGGDGPVLRPFFGGMVETGIGRATVLAAAGAWPDVERTDVGPSSHHFDDDLTEPIELGADGLMHAPTGPGIGVAPRPERLAEVTVDRCTIRA